MNTNQSTRWDDAIFDAMQLAGRMVVGLTQHRTIDASVIQHVLAAQVELTKAWAIVDANINGDYQQYLASDQWRRIRNLVLERDGFKCRRCGDGGRAADIISHLDVHHITYDRRGEEHLDDLVLLCRRCHQWVHESGMFAAGRYQETEEERTTWLQENPDFAPV